ncbi:cadherin-like domain-containing protein, partial [Stappia sp. F7233]
TSDNPSAGAQGLSRTISFTVDDGGAENAASAPVSVTVGITAVNDAPVVSGDVSLETAEDTPLIIAEAELLALASDPDGDALSIQNLTAASGTLVNNGDGTWTFTPPAGFDGNVALSYQVSDGELVTQASANVEVVSVANEAPVLNLPTPTGGDIRVNSYTSENQADPIVASLADGGFVVTWGSYLQDSSAYGIYAQRYNAAGIAVGTEFRVNNTTAENQGLPVVAGLANGGFVVTWESNLQDGSGVGVYGRQYNSAGSAVGSEFRVNTYTTNHQTFQSVAALENGGFVVTWSSLQQDGSSWGVYGQRYSASGTRVGSEFRINSYTTDVQAYPSVASLTDGGFIATWHSLNQDGSSWGIYGQRYNSSGGTVGSEFRINSYTTNHQNEPSVTGLVNGGFVVTWHSFNQDGSSWGIYGRRYNSSGSAVGSEFRVNNFTTDTQSDSYVTALTDGGFVVTWNSFNQDGSSWGVYGRRYNASGSAIGSEFRINSYTPNEQSRPSVTALEDGGFVVAWHSNGQDGSGYGVFRKIYNADGTERIGPSYIEGSGAVAFATNLTISDVDSTTLVGATIDIDNFVAGQDVLTFNNQNGISGFFDGSSGTLTLSGNATVTAYQAALRSVGYLNTSNDPTGTGRDISITVNDGTGATQTSNTVTAHVNVIGVPGDNAVAGEAFAATSAGDADIFQFDAAAGAQVLDAFAAGDGDVAGDGIVDAVAFDTGSGLASFDDVLSHAAQVAEDVVIDLDGDASLTLKGVEIGQLTADDFRFIA